MEVREVSAQNTPSDLAHEDCTRNATLAQNEQLPLNASLVCTVQNSNMMRVVLAHWHT